MGRTARPVGLALGLAGCAIAGLLAVLLGSLREDGPGGPAPTATTAPTRVAQTLADEATRPAGPAATLAPGSAEEVVARVSGGVVTVVREERDGSGGWNAAGNGTGFVIDTEGHVVTAARVVEGGGRVTVLFPDGTGRVAEIVGTDRVSDLAVVQVDGAVPMALAFGDSDALRPGRPVLAIGSPLGSFSNTVTRGVVSALGRSLGDQPDQPAIGGLIQHDAAINEGNAGGPLLDLSGQVVGVNTAAVQQTSSGETAQGLFFAVPSNTVARVVRALIADGRMRYPYLGVETASVTPAVAAASDLGTDRGVLVLRVVAGGPAEQAGIEAGDVLLGIGGRELGPALGFTDALFRHEPGETVTITVLRDGETLSLEATLGERPADL